MRQSNGFKRALWVASAFVLVGMHDLIWSGDDRLIPAMLTDDQKAHLKMFLETTAKPTRLVPIKARIVDTLPDGLNANPAPGVEVKQYLAAVLPDVAVSSQSGPEKATVLWYRPNPQRGMPGVTVRQVVDLKTGMAVGVPDVLFNHATPLTREERDEALALAFRQSPALRNLYSGVDPKDVDVATLLQVISASGQADGAIGDRVVNLRIRNPKSERRIKLMVNLTRQTVRDPNAP